MTGRYRMAAWSCVLFFSIPAVGIGIAAAQTTASPEIRFGIPTAPAKAPGTIRIATYNVENLFDDHDDPALSGQYEDTKSVKPEPALRGVAAAIRAIDADVLALEEVESEKVLLWFRDTYLKDMGYVHAASLDAGDERGIEQSVLSRFPITGVKNWARLPLAGVHPEKADAPAGTPLVFHRSPLKVDVRVSPAVASPGAPATPYEFTLLAVHMKSGRSSAYWREAEAAKIVELVGELEKEKPGRNVMVLGDLNSVPLDRSFRTFVGSSVGGNLIDLFADRVTPGSEGAPRFITHESGRTIDHILYNRAMEPEVGASGSGGRFILGTPARPAGVDWRNYPAPAGYGSDHYPVVVDIVASEGGREGSVKGEAGGER